MKMLPSLLLFASLAAMSPLAALAQKDLPEVKVDDLLKELDMIEVKQKSINEQGRAAIVAAVSAGSTTGPVAANFYEKAIEQVQFQGKKNKGAEFVDWKKANADFLRSREMQTALLLHLKYLAMSLQRQGMEKPENMLPEILAYVNELIAAEGIVSGQAQYSKEASNLLAQSVGQSIFAQWLQFGQWLPDDNIWESKPSDVSGILEKNVRSIMRDTKDPRLLQTWDLQLQVEADRITKARLQILIDKYNNLTRPRLLFQRAQDMVLLGQPNRAVGEIVALLRAHPSHPDFSTWLGEVRSLLAKKQEGQTSPQ